LSQSDVDLYIKICSESDPTAKAKILSDASASDPVGVGMNQGKIGSVASLLMAGQDANAIKASLGAIPNFTITDDEIKFLIDQKDALVAATKAAANIQ
jgi:hypothetical protein